MRKLFHGATTCLLLALLAGITPVATVPAAASDSVSDSGGVKLTVRGSGYQVPRFVALKSDEVNMRAGPGTEYPVLWQYRKEGLPLRVEREFGIWRKVVDHEDTTGWMHQSVVSLKRNALVTASNALLELQSCPTQWCKVASGDIRGWVARTAIWGLLDGEVLN